MEDTQDLSGTIMLKAQIVVMVHPKSLARTISPILVSGETPSWANTH